MLRHLLQEKLHQPELVCTPPLPVRWVLCQENFMEEPMSRS